MKSMLIFLLLVFVSQPVFSQPRALDSTLDYFPNKVDSNFFYVSLAASFYFEGKKDENTLQKKSLKQRTEISGNRPYRAEMEFLMFPLNNYEARMQPHIFLRLDAFLTYYSGTYGIGISDKKLNSSLGVFHGHDTRRVPDEGNTLTRRNKLYAEHQMYGFYLQSSSEHVSFYFSLEREHKKAFEYVRLAYRPAGKFTFFRKGIQKDLQLVFSKEKFSGVGVGFSLRCFKNTSIEFLHISPGREDREYQARVEHDLRRGFLIRLSYCVR